MEDNPWRQRSRWEPEPRKDIHHGKKRLICVNAGQGIAYVSTVDSFSAWWLPVSKCWGQGLRVRWWEQGLIRPKMMSKVSHKLSGSFWWTWWTVQNVLEIIDPMCQVGGIKHTVDSTLNILGFPGRSSSLEVMEDYWRPDVKNTVP